jgi:hypothetical protein
MQGSVRRDGALFFFLGVDLGCGVRERAAVPARNTGMLARRLACATPVAMLLLPCATWAAAQVPDPEAWDSPRVTELLERARQVRQSATVDPEMRTYQAEARGYVYFFVDRPDSDEHVLVKADQVALDLYWRAPNDAKQRMVGQRDEKVLPTNIRYHLDHLTVVQDDYGDFIRLGDGDEVEQVPHPVGPDSEEVYDFRLVDSLSLAYGDGQEVRVYEVQVRPKRFDLPGLIGTIFLDRATAAIVRMNFSFTPTSYVDDYLDYIRISLDNSLWLGRHWLPYRQEVELRREMPVLDFSMGSVIRSRFEIGGYEFNVDIAPTVFQGRGVSALPLSQRRAFLFERGLFDEVDEEGLTVSTKMEEVRTQVREVVEDEVLSGLSPLRLHFDGISDFARYNRAEGVFLGGGITLRPHGDLKVRPAAGYAFGRQQPSGSLSATREGGSVVPTLDAYWDRLGDIGGNPGAEPLVNTISAASGSKDFLDPYFRRGGTLELEFGGATVGLQVEEHGSATDVVSDGQDSEFRPVLRIHEGTLGKLEVSTSFGLWTGARARLGGAVGRLEDRDLFVADATVDWRLGNRREGVHGRFFALGGATNPGAPAQSMYLIGGRHTLPGHDYRSFVGNAYWLARAEGTVPVRPPYVGIRAFGVVGATHLGAVDLPADWALSDSDGLRGSVGLGLSIGWDTVYFDVAHGVRGGGWEAVFSVSEQFQGWM